MNTKNNVRAVKTRALICDTLINLLTEKTISSISVSELCETAGINRTTFYSYYNSLDSLLEYIDDDLAERLLKMIHDRHKEDICVADKEDLMIYLNFIKENQREFSIYFKNTNVLRFKNDMRRFLRSSVKYYIEAKIAEKQNAAEDDIDRVLDFYEAGLYALIRRWVINGCYETTEYVALIVNNCITDYYLQ